MSKGFRWFIIGVCTVFAVATLVVLVAPVGRNKNALPLQYREMASEVVADYCLVQKGLARDFLGEAQQASADLQGAANAMLKEPMPEVASATRFEWGSDLLLLARTAQALEKSGDLKQAREIFKTFSEQMIAFVEKFGHAHYVPLHVVHCSMAFNNTGADWLQSSEKIRNPYFGKEMLECGEIVKTFPPGK